jgi:hypothetical protein
LRRLGVDRSPQQEAAAQLATAAALDAKLTGILGFMVAVVGILLTVKHGLTGYRWILLAGAGGALVIALLALIGADDPKAGPDPIDLYRRFGGGEHDEFLGQLLVKLEEAIDTNKNASMNGGRCSPAHLHWRFSPQPCSVSSVSPHGYSRDSRAVREATI